ncbi:MAG: hypothetical protein ABIH23_14450 [bacterium]
MESVKSLGDVKIYAYRADYEKIDANLAALEAEIAELKRQVKKLQRGTGIQPGAELLIDADSLLARVQALESAGKPPREGHVGYYEYLVERENIVRIDERERAAEKARYVLREWHSTILVPLDLINRVCEAILDGVEPRADSYPSSLRRRTGRREDRND